MQQNTPEWEKLRQGKIGASDANVIMGVSEFMTPLDLYLKKKGLPPRKPEQDIEFIASKGHFLEAKFRAELELETGCEFPPEIRIHEQIDYLMASMDGYNEGWKMGAEFKYVGQDDFIKVSNWNPETDPFPLPQYYPQIQQQYLCSGAVRMALVAITEQVDTETDGITPKKVNNKLVYILNEHGKKQYKKVLRPVPLDMEYIKNELLPKVIEFQTEYINKNIEPPATEADIIEIKNLTVGKKVTEYKKNQEKINKLKTSLKPLESTAKTLKDEIFKMELVSAPKMLCKGLTLTQYDVTGKTDYESAFNSFKDNLKMVLFALDNYGTLDEIRHALDGVLNLSLDNFKKANTKAYKIALPKPDKKESTKTTTETVKVGDQSKTTSVEIKPTEIMTVEPIVITIDKDTVTDHPAPTILDEANDFKTEKGKTPRGWAGKDITKKIEYLQKYAKRSDTPEKIKTQALMLVSKLAVIKHSSGGY